MPEEHLYIVTYDISDQKRWRKVFKLLKGYGHWLQLSIFQCRLTAKRQADMAARIEDLIKTTEDHVLILDLGQADKVKPSIQSLGKNYKMPTREAIII